MARIIHHFRLDIRGALLNWTEAEFRSLQRDDGTYCTSLREAKLLLMDELAKGHLFLPCGPCEGFDYVTGCPGHPCDEEAEHG